MPESMGGQEKALEGTSLRGASASGYTNSVLEGKNISGRFVNYFSIIFNLTLDTSKIPEFCCIACNCPFSSSFWLKLEQPMGRVGSWQGFNTRAVRHPEALSTCSCDKAKLPCPVWLKSPGVQGLRL